MLSSISWPGVFTRSKSAVDVLRGRIKALSDPAHTAFERVTAVTLTTIKNSYSKSDIFCYIISSDCMLAVILFHFLRPGYLAVSECRRVNTNSHFNQLQMNHGGQIIII